MKKLGLVGLALAVLSAAWILGQRHATNTEIAVELPITAFAPLDPQAGNTLSYRLGLGREDPCLHTEGKIIDRHQAQCLCFQDSSGQPRPSWAGACEARPASCSIFLRGTCPWSGFELGIEHFQVPEADRYWLELVPPKSTVVLWIGSGTARVKAFRPEAQDYERWVAKQKQNHPKKLGD